MNQIAILLVSGKKEDYDYMQDLFLHLKSARFCTDWADTYESAQLALYKKHYDIALVEDDLELMRGSQFIEKAKQNGIDVPVILFANSNNWQGDEAAFQSDAICCLDRDKMTSAKLEDIILKELDLRRMITFLQF